MRINGINALSDLDFWNLTLNSSDKWFAMNILSRSNSKHYNANDSSDKKEANKVINMRKDI